MPKKPVHGRAKQNRNRNQRAGARPVSRSGSTQTADPGMLPGDPVNGVGEAAFVPAAGGVVAAPATPAQRVGGTTGAVRRSAGASRRAPVMTINYHYLARDLRSLAVLAPTMIILLVIAFFVFH